jgi:hypothetical protein
LLVAGGAVYSETERPPGADYGRRGRFPPFRPIFDGKTLVGWEGDPKYRRVEDGNLVGKVAPETLLKSNNFIIRRPEGFRAEGGLPDHGRRQQRHQLPERGSGTSSESSAATRQP